MGGLAVASLSTPSALLARLRSMRPRGRSWRTLSEPFFGLRATLSRFVDVVRTHGQKEMLQALMNK